MPSIHYRKMEYKPIPLPLHFSVKSKKPAQEEQPQPASKPTQSAPKQPQPTPLPMPLVIPINYKPAKPKMVAKLCEHKVANQTIQPARQHQRTYRQSARKHYFTPEEDEQLRQLYNEHGRNFKAINFVMTNFKERQLKERWDYYLDPKINKEPFSFDEDCLLIEKVRVCNSRWCRIVEYFPGRTVHQIKYRHQFLSRAARNSGCKLTPEFIREKTEEWAGHIAIGQKRQKEELKEGRSESEDEAQTDDENEHENNHVERALSVPIPPIDENAWIEPAPDERLPVIDEAPAFMPEPTQLADIPIPDDIPNYDANYGDYEDYHDYGTIDGTWNDL